MNSRPKRLAVGEAVGPAGQVEDLGRGSRPNRQKQGRGEVGRGDGVAVGIGPDLVAGAVDGAASDAAAGEDRAVAVRPVVAAGLGVDLGRPAELAQRDHQRRFEQAAAGQVVDQGGEGPVGRRAAGRS